jgi:hypothetical protein
VTDIACWITFFADGASRNSSRWDLYSRLGADGFLRADGMVSLLGCMYGISPYLARHRLIFHGVSTRLSNGQSLTGQANANPTSGVLVEEADAGVF